MSGTNEADLVPYTEILRQECPYLRILVVGKCGAGKSELINTVFGINATSVSDRMPGVHDINKPLSFSSNEHIIIHDSEGFEPGEDAKVHEVLDFIDHRSKMPTLADRLHAIWVCAEIPFAGSRPFEAGVENILKIYRNNVPIVVVFTKLDILRFGLERKIEEELEQQGKELDDEEFDAMVDTKVDAAVHTLCVEPLQALTGVGSYPWIATSTRSEERFRKTTMGLVDLALKVTKPESIWIGIATAQRSNAKASIAASVRIGRKRYWRGLLSDIFLGFSMRKVLEVLQKDIVNVWNMKDPDAHLQKPEFLVLISVLVEDLSDEQTNNYPLTEMAINAIIENPAAIIIAGPTAVVLLFAEWVRGTYKKTKSSLRCLIAFIIDLTLTMDTLFYLDLSRGQKRMKIGLVNKALQIYKSRKAPVHASIRAWADGWGTFDHMDFNVVINKIAELVEEYSVKPEEWAMQDEVADENWIPVDILREKQSVYSM